MDLLRDLGPVAALATTGLMAGVYLAFAISVMPGLARTADDVLVPAMRAMNAAILNPVFAVVFAGPLVLDVLALAVGAGPRGWLVTALATYAVTLVVTAAVNVPLNNRLDATEPVVEARALFETRWVRWNLVRVVACTASFLALVRAVVVG